MRHTLLDRVQPRSATLVLLWLCMAMGVEAQNNWARRVGSWSLDAFNDIAVDAAGNSYVTGEFGAAIQEGGFLVQSQGSMDIVVAKYDASGQPLWVRGFGGPGLDRGISIAVGAGGEVVVTGVFMATVDFDGQTLTSQATTQDMFVMRVDPEDGSVLWVRQGGGPTGADRPYALSVANDGRVAVTGEFRGTAVFDAGTITSMTDPDAGLPSVDIFVAAYAANGDALWLKHGSAKFTDRGMAVAHDALGNVYVSGQFGDTLTFDQVHNNTLLGAVFVVRFGQAGQEEWFRVFGGALSTSVFDLQVVNGDRLMLTGDMQGTAFYFDGQPNSVQAAAPRSSFLLEVGLSGGFMRATTWGSDNMVSTRSLSVHGDAVDVFGRFQCQFTGFSAQHGEGTWIATGQHDLYVARFSLADLALQEAQQFGGQGDKVAASIAHMPDGAPVFCGSFGYLLVFPRNAAGTFTTMPGAGVQVPQAPAGFCGDPFYTGYAGLSAGNNALMEAFVARGWALGRRPYDIFNRPPGACDRPQRDIRIDRYGQGVYGPDTLELCDSDTLVVITNTAYSANPQERHNAPALTFQWSTGETGDFILAATTGWYHVTVSSPGGCWSRTDSVYLLANDSPPAPLINDDLGFNTDAGGAVFVIACDPEVPWLWASGVDPSHNVAWNGPTGPVQGDSILATVNGQYSVGVTSPAGCSAFNLVQVLHLPSGPLPPLDASFELFFFQDDDQNDTASVCTGQPVFYSTEVDVFLDGAPYDLPPWVRLYRRCSGSEWFWVQPPGSTAVSCMGNLSSPGWHVYTMDILLTNAPCGEDSLLFSVTDSVFVQTGVAQPPAATIVGPQYICPNDTVTIQLVCTGCDDIEWWGTPVLADFGDSIHVTTAGDYNVVVTNFEFGCTGSNALFSSIDWNPTPQIGILPGAGVICPGQEAMLYSSLPGTSYQWYGPQGPLPQDSSVITTAEPGLYYLEMVDYFGCPVTSPPVLVEEYATPYLFVLPDNVLCNPGETATLQVVVPGFASVQWQAPLGGGAPQQVVNTPGVYTCLVESCGVNTMASVDIIGNQAVAALTDPGPYVVCEGSDLVVQAQPGMMLYYWEPGTVPGPSFSITAPGDYTLVAVDYYGCEASLDFVVDAIPPIPLVLAPDTTICPGGAAVYALPAGFSAPVWGDGSTGNTFTATMPGAVTVAAIGQNGCPSWGNAQVFFHLFEEPADAPPVSICLGDDALLTVTGSGTFQWFADAALQVPVGAGNTVAVAQPTDSAVYYVVQSDGTCSVPFPVLLNVTPLQTEATLLAPDVICAGEPLQITLVAEAEVVGVWTTPAGPFTGTLLLVPAAASANSGTYTVVPTVGICQGLPLSTFVSVQMPELPGLGDQLSYCDGGEYPVALPDEYTDVVWSTGTTGNVLLVTSAGSYTVTAIDPQGCPVEESFTVVMVDCDVVLPNVFSPNGDGVNDAFVLSPGPFLNAHMTVFNRFGNLVWEGDPTGLGFRGFHYANYEPLSEGAYYYVLRLERSGGRVQERTGYVHILR